MMPWSGSHHAPAWRLLGGCWPTMMLTAGTRPGLRLAGADPKGLAPGRLCGGLALGLPGTQMRLQPGPGLGQLTYCMGPYRFSPVGISNSPRLPSMIQILGSHRKLTVCNRLSNLQT